MSTYGPLSTRGRPGFCLFSSHSCGTIFVRVLNHDKYFSTNCWKNHNVVSIFNVRWPKLLPQPQNFKGYALEKKMEQNQEVFLSRTFYPQKVYSGWLFYWAVLPKTMVLWSYDVWNFAAAILLWFYTTWYFDSLKLWNLGVKTILYGLVFCFVFSYCPVLVSSFFFPGYLCVLYLDFTFIFGGCIFAFCFFEQFCPIKHWSGWTYVAANAKQWMIEVDEFVKFCTK